MRVSRTYAAYADAAGVLIASGRPITVIALAQVRCIEDRVARRYFEHHPEHARLIGLKTNTEIIVAAYAAASALIRARQGAEESRKITTANLASEMRIRPRTIRAFLRRHPETARSIGWVDNS